MDAIPQIDIHEAKKLLDQGDVMFVDVRDEMSHRMAHIAGSQHLDDRSVEDFVKNTDKKRTLVVYCYHGNNSMGGTEYLLGNGFESVFSMSGGFEAWRGVYDSEPPVE